MGAPLTTSVITITSTPSVPAAPASSAESPGGSGFQPMLAAASQAATPVAEPTAAAAAAAPSTTELLSTTGNGLPVDGEALPPELVGLTLQAQPDAAGEEGAAMALLPDAATVVGLPTETVAESAPADDDSDDSDDEQAVDPALMSVDGVVPQPAATDPADGAALPVAAVATPTAAVDGDIKRPLPASGQQAIAAAAPAAVQTQESAANVDATPIAAVQSDRLTATSPRCATICCATIHCVTTHCARIRARRRQRHRSMCRSVGKAGMRRCWRR